MAIAGRVSKERDGWNRPGSVDFEMRNETALRGPQHPLDPQEWKVTEIEKIRQRESALSLRGVFHVDQAE